MSFGQVIKVLYASLILSGELFKRCSAAALVSSKSSFMKELCDFLFFICETLIIKFSLLTFIIIFSYYTFVAREYVTTNYRVSRSCCIRDFVSPT